MKLTLEQELSVGDDGVIAKRFEFQLKLLDEAHARAKGPKARKRIEAKAAELIVELEDLRQKAKVVDIEYARWLRRFNEMLGES
jgi:hypothetical protein